MKVPPGFKVTDRFAIDDRGRLKGHGKDRILIFEDVDGDGKFDKKTVFIDNLNLVRGIELSFGGVWVDTAPYLLFIPITPGEDKPAGSPQILLPCDNSLRVALRLQQPLALQMTIGFAAKANSRRLCQRRECATRMLNWKPNDYLLVNCTGVLKEASPRLASAQAHQICTLATLGTYAGTVML
jgi:hypothetical protein